MTRRESIATLAILTDLKFKVAQAELAEILTREARLKDNLAQLVEKRAAQANATRDPAEAALVAGADTRWLRWVDQRRAAINTELAQLLALKQTKLASLKRAFGRDQAAQKVQNKVRTAERAQARRRADYES